MKSTFIPGKTYIPASGKVFDEEEINNAIAAAKDGWWTEGRFAKQFEKEFVKFLGVRYVSLVNSGSSANLIALASLTARVFGSKRLKSGDEFITSPVAFPTTVNPGILYGLIPVFVDVEPGNLNIDADKIEKAISKKTKLIMTAHTLGKPFNLAKIMKLVRKYNLWLIEDCADALGSKYDGKLVGTFGHIATFSFYAAHQITMGEGGAVVTGNPLIHRTIRQFRDWGRDCWCDTGRDNTCGKRFAYKLGGLPFGYDHKYIYSQIGYNLKLTDFQAAIGCAQLRKLPFFIKKRKENYHLLYDYFKRYQNYFHLFEAPRTCAHGISQRASSKLKSAEAEKGLCIPRPYGQGIPRRRIENSEKEDSCWFGFPVMVKENAPFTRNQLTEYLEKNKIGTRNVFSGNLLKHPAYQNIRYKTVSNLTNADRIMSQAFWIGVFPGIGDKQIDYIKKTIDSFLKARYSSSPHRE